MKEIQGKSILVQVNTRLKLRGFELLGGDCMEKENVLMVVGIKHGKYMYHFDLYMHDMLPFNVVFHIMPLFAIF